MQDASKTIEVLIAAPPTPTTAAAEAAPLRALKAAPRNAAMGARMPRSASQRGTVRRRRRAAQPSTLYTRAAAAKRADRVCAAVRLSNRPAITAAAAPV